METIKLILSVVIAALLPALVNASVNPVANFAERSLGYLAAFAEAEVTPWAYYERYMNHEPVTAPTAAPARIAQQGYINSSLRPGNHPVMASFERGIYREPFAVVMAPATAESQELILSLMNSGKGSAVASFDLDQLRNLVCKLK